MALAQLVKEPAGAPESRRASHPPTLSPAGGDRQPLSGKSALQVERSQYLSGRAFPPEPAGEEGAWELTSGSEVEGSQGRRRP